MVLSLGSNLGDREEHINKAVEHIATWLERCTLSSLIETPALLPKNAPDSWDIPFINAALSGYTALSSEAILEKTQAIETALGRPEEHDLWSPRIIDIDILVYSDQVISTPTLTIPHAGLLKRDFFLLPLAEIAPNWRYPAKGEHYEKTATELKHQFVKKVNSE